MSVDPIRPPLSYLGASTRLDVLSHDRHILVGVTPHCVCLADGSFHGVLVLGHPHQEIERLGRTCCATEEYCFKEGLLQQKNRQALHLLSELHVPDSMSSWLWRTRVVVSLCRFYQRPSKRRKPTRADRPHLSPLPSRSVWTFGGHGGLIFNPFFQS